MPEISAADKLREAEREIAQRKHVYPRLIEAGKLTKQKAERQIAVMEAIACDYRAQAETEKMKGMLL